MILNSYISQTHYFVVGGGGGGEGGEREGDGGEYIIVHVDYDHCRM